MHYICTQIYIYICTYENIKEIDFKLKEKKSIYEKACA